MSATGLLDRQRPTQVNDVRIATFSCWRNGETIHQRVSVPCLLETPGMVEDR